MTSLMFALLVLAALSLGLRTTSVLLHPTTQSPRRGGPAASRFHPIVRLALSLLIGAVLTLAFLELCRSYRVFELGLGLLVSLSPVGLFDVAKWWFQWNRRLPG